ncbi:MAG: hypothetical protein AB1468_01075 [Candidatus Micrarchaeota archaeon]
MILEYNKMRDPEATASLVRLKNRKALVRFSGPFCASCGITDYFDDFVIEAGKQGLKLVIKKIRQTGGESYSVEFEEVVW